MSFGISILGIKGTLRAIDAKIKQERNACGYALYNMAQDVLDKSLKLVPVAPDGGNLRRSGYVSSPKKKGGREIIVYVGYNTDYAVYVHEIPPPPQKSLKGRSARHDPPTQWKYLSLPFDWYQSSAERKFQKYKNEFILHDKPEPKSTRKGQGRV